MTTNLAIPNREGTEELEWGKLVDDLLDQVDQYPESVVKATELLINGHSTRDVDRAVDQPAGTVKKWLTRYPAMAIAVAKGRRMASTWRLTKMEQQFFDAVAASQEVLDVSVTDKEVNPKVLATKAQHARYIIGLFLGQKVDVNVNIRAAAPILNAEPSGLEYLSSRLKEEEAIEVEYVVETPKADQGPLTDDNGNPRFGEYGDWTLDGDGKKQCHICGSFYLDMKSHIVAAHKIKHAEYRRLYGVDFNE